MKRTQKGMSFIGLVLTLGIIAIVALLVLRVVPAYIEYFAVKKAVATVAKSGPSSASDVRAAFAREMNINDIDIITSRDIVIAGTGSDLTLSFAYDKRIPLIANVSLYIEFAGSSSASGSK